MDIVNKINKLLGDQVTAGPTTTTNVALNLAKGHVDVIGGGCPKGQRYDSKKKVCVPVKSNEGYKIQIKGITHDWRDDEPHKIYDKKAAEKVMKKAIKAGRKASHIRVVKESSVVGGSYIGGTTVNIIGSGQTRTWGVKSGDGAHRGSTRGMMSDLYRKNKKNVISADKTVENLGRRGLKFNHILGAYVPDHWIEEEE